MLHFLRKHQKIFFVFITVVIVFSFAFFGTYQAFTPMRRVKDNLAFKTSSGKKVGSHYLGQFCQFLKYEGAGKDFFSTNFLNDFVITADILDAGLGTLIFEKNSKAIGGDLVNRLQREKLFLPYVHPYANQLNAMTVWSLFAPQLHDKLAELRKVEDATDPSGFATRVDLFMAERRFPPQMLANMLRYQERDAKGLPADQRLMRSEVSLFGYNNLEDWFGPTFIEDVVKLIMEGAELAKVRGHRVTKEEVMSQLLYRSQKTYESMKESVNLPVSDGAGLLQLFIRQSGFEEANLVKICQTITLYHRLLDEVGGGVLVDTMPLEDFQAYAGQAITVSVKQMPKELRFTTKEELEQFETYLSALRGEMVHPLLLPTQINPAPQLVGKRYRLYVADVNKEQLVSKVSVQQTWAWEEENLQMLAEQFSQLHETPLEELSVKQRSPIDAFARKQIAQTHPEWIEESLKTALMKESELFISPVSSRQLLKGIHDNSALVKLLDEEDEIVNYTQDGVHFYRILVQERSENEVLSFASAKREGVIDELSAQFGGHANQVIAAIANIEGVSEQEAISYRFCQQLCQAGDVLEQFKPVSRELTLSRIEPGFIPFETVQATEDGFGAAMGEGAYYYHVVDRRSDCSPSLEKLVRSQEILAKEVKRAFMKKQFFSMLTH